MTTDELEIYIYFHLAKLGTYLCFEVMMPFDFLPNNRMNNERVDLLTYNTKGEWRFYELKVSVSDFHSKAKKTFYGNFNYFVMPRSVYEKVKNEIPDGIGCYIVDDNYHFIESVKKAKCMKFAGNEDSLKKAFTQSLSRQHFQLMSVRRENLRKRPWMQTEIEMEGTK